MSGLVWFGFFARSSARLRSDRAGFNTLRKPSLSPGTRLTVYFARKRDAGVALVARGRSVRMIGNPGKDCAWRMRDSR